MSTPRAVNFGSSGIRLVARPEHGLHQELHQDAIDLRLQHGHPFLGIGIAVHLAVLVRKVVTVVQHEAGLVEGTAPVLGVRVGDGDLVDDVSSGRVDLDALSADRLPASIATLPAAERVKKVKEAMVERSELQRQMKDLATKRDSFLATQVRALGGAKESLDQQLYNAVKKQANESGLRYEEEAPKY